MRAWLFGLLCVAAIVGIPATAGAASVEKATGSAYLVSGVGVANVNVHAFAIEGDSDAASGSVRMRSNTVAEYNFDLTITSMTVFPNGAHVVGTDSTGRPWAILVFDGGSSGAGADEVYTIRYELDEQGLYQIGTVMWWGAGTGNLSVHN